MRQARSGLLSRFLLPRRKVGLRVTLASGSLVLAVAGALVPAYATPVGEAAGETSDASAMPAYVIDRTGSGPQAAAAELVAAQLVELIARVEAAASDASLDEGGVLAAPVGTGNNQRPRLSERGGHRAEAAAGAEPTHAPGSALAVLARIVNVHGGGGSQTGDADGADEESRRRSALAEAASGLSGLNDELERYIVSLVEPRVAADGSVYFSFPGIGEFRADYDASSGVLAVRGSDAEVRLRLQERLRLDEGLLLEDGARLEAPIPGTVDGTAGHHLTLERLLAIVGSLFGDARVWYVLVPMLFISMLIVRDGSAEVRERRRRRRAAGKVRGLGTSDGSAREDGATEHGTQFEDLTEYETLDGTQLEGHATKRRKRRRTAATKPVASKSKPKPPGLFGTLMRSLGLKRDTPGKKVPLGGEKRGQRRRRKHRGASSASRTARPTGSPSA